MVVDALVTDTEVLDPKVAEVEVVDAEVADAVVDLFVLGTVLNAVPVPDKEDAGFLDKEAEDLNAMVGFNERGWRAGGTGTLSMLKLLSLSSWWTCGH